MNEYQAFRKKSQCHVIRSLNLSFGVIDKGEYSKPIMSKNIAKAAKKGMQKATQKAIHPPFLKTNIPACEAVPAPPLGPQLGAVSDPLVTLSKLDVNFGYYRFRISSTTVFKFLK